MHLLVDAIAVRAGSAAIVIEHLLHGWRSAAPDDRVTVLAGPGGPEFELPAGVDLVRADLSLPGAAGGIWLRSVTVRRTARRLGVDVLLSGVPASGLLGAGCPRGLILYDLRHELRPHQFSCSQRFARRVSWWWSMRRADAIFTISERTLTDLRHRHPRLAAKGVAAQLGSDHVSSWPAIERAEPPYALAFGHFANKNAHAVIEAWAQFCKNHDDWRLRLVGMSSADRSAAAELVDRLGLADLVELMPWLDDESFSAIFAAAGMVVFPSDFEGFGLPAAEALRLGIPVVVSPDPALAEVTGGHAVVAASAGPHDLADAMQQALSATSEQLTAGQRYADGFTWAGTATTIRDTYARGVTSK